MRSLYRLASGPGGVAVFGLAALLSSPNFAHAAEELAAGPPADQRLSFFHYVIYSNGIIFGPLMLLAALVLLVLVVSLTFGLRRRRTLGNGLAARLGDAIAGGPERMREVVGQDRSFLGQAVSAGLARLPNGPAEARHAARSVIEQVRAPRERTLRWLLGLACLVPLLGLLGTLLGATLTCLVMAQPGAQFRTEQFAEGFGHALCVLLEAVLLAFFALAAYIAFKNRLQALMLATDATADDLLTRCRTSAG